MKLFGEEILEPVARYFRFQEGLKFIPRNRPIILVDIGCGPKIRFHHFAKKHGIIFKKYIGIDSLITHVPDDKILLIKNSLKTEIPVENNTVDIVCGLAFLEHIDNPKKILTDAVRILRKKGLAIFTTPAPLSKKILEFLSFRLGLISKREIAEHKNYFDKESLLKLLPENKNLKIIHRYFEFGLNNLLVIEKLE